MQGGEVREAMSHSSWEGDRLHCGVRRFLKIKTGPETAHLFGCRCPPRRPHSYSRVFPSSSKHIQSNSGQYPIFEKEGRIKRKKKKRKKKTQLQPYAARTRKVDDAREENAEVTVSTSQVIAILSGAASPTPLQATTPLAGFSLGRLGRGLRRGREAGEERSRRGRKQSWEHSACQPGLGGSAGAGS